MWASLDVGSAEWAIGRFRYLGRSHNRGVVEMIATNASGFLRSSRLAAALADSWWAVALRGVMAILFGVFAFFWPGVTMLSLVIVFAAYCLVDGGFGVIMAIKAFRRGDQWGLLLLNGLLGLIIAGLTFYWPGITVLAFVLLIAAWAFLSGGLMLYVATRVKRSQGRWWLVFGGVVSIAYGAALVIAPLVGALVLTWWIGAHALILGGTLIVIASKLRSHGANDGATVVVRGAT